MGKVTNLRLHGKACRIQHPKNVYQQQKTRIKLSCHKYDVYPWYFVHRDKKRTATIIMIMIIQMIHSQKLPLQRILTIRWSYSMIRPLNFTFVQDEMVLCR